MKSSKLVPALLSFLYQIISPFVIVAILIRLWARGFRNPAVKRNWHERLGGNVPQFDQRPVWVHAVSVGESMAALPLIEAIQAEGIPVLITTGTTTAQDALAMQAPELDRRLVPVDSFLLLVQFLLRLRPRGLVIMETELWPNMLLAARHLRLPTVIANARLSPSSRRRYPWIQSWIRDLTRTVTVIAQNEDEQQAYELLLGRPATLGLSLKDDCQAQPVDIERGNALRQQVGSKRPVLLAASTHPGEEALIVTAFQTLLKTHPDTLLILAPRHPNRCTNIATLQLVDLSIAKWQEREDINDWTAINVLLIDEIGVLKALYAASDVAVIGGSLIPHGGHNVIEAILHDCVVTAGNQGENFSTLIEPLATAGGALIHKDPQQISASLAELLNDNKRRQSINTHAHNWLSLRAGAISKHIHALRACGILPGNGHH